VRSIRFAVPLVLALQTVAMGGVPAAADQTERTSELLEKLATLPQNPHNSEVLVDRSPGGTTRVSIRPNEDDLRLYTPARAQMDVDVQPSYVFASGSLPGDISLVVETRGTAKPGPGDRRLTLVADGTPLFFSQREGPASASGTLLFLSIEARLSRESFLALVTASRVEGRVWGLPFVLLDSQLELLRAFAAPMASPAAR
jgi:hypothetical protein